MSHAKQHLPVAFIESMADIIKIIGNPQRLQILEYLDIHGETDVNAIVEGVKGQQNAVSQHLNKMRLAGIIASRRAGRQILYKIAAENAVTILNCMRKRYHGCTMLPGESGE